MVYDACLGPHVDWFRQLWGGSEIGAITKIGTPAPVQGLRPETPERTSELVLAPVSFMGNVTVPIVKIVRIDGICS